METSKQFRQCITNFVNRITDENFDHETNQLFAELQQNPHWLFGDMGDASTLLEQFRTPLSHDSLRNRFRYSDKDMISMAQQYAAQEMTRFIKRYESVQSLTEKSPEIESLKEQLKEAIYDAKELNALWKQVLKEKDELTLMVNNNHEQVTKLNHQIERMKRERDEYYDELIKKRQRVVELEEEIIRLKSKLTHE
jgi:uncharacterized coiled-coil DUF342 family protein